tara:strand:+ start:262 stop:1128 length:867 start_codon:yes stop_codon:yes gene_type:complete
VLFLGNALKVTSQIVTEIPKNQLGISHDNDFLVITDRYYTFGLSLFYIHSLNEGIFENTKEQVSFKLFQQAYTPTNLETRLIEEMDRPYAGFLGLETGWSFVKSNTFYKTNLLIGIVGPSSGVGQFQRWYHDHIVKYKTPTWENELDNLFHANLSFHFAKEWAIAPNPFGVRFALSPSAVVGSKDVLIQPELITYFGRRSSLENSMAYGQINNLEKEIYFSLGFAYKYVTKNTYLELNNIESEVFLFNFNFHHRYLTNEYRVGFHYNTKEAKNLEGHRFISLGYAKSF